MNVQEIVPQTLGTLAHYVETALPLTLVTVWVVMAFQSRYWLGNQDISIWMRLAWPLLLIKRLREQNNREEKMYPMQVWEEHA